MKKSSILISSIVLVSSMSVFASSSVSATENREVKTFSYSSIPNNIKAQNKSKGFALETSGKQYLTEEEVKKVDLSQLKEISEELDNAIKSGTYQENELNQIAAEKIKSIQTSEFSIMGYDVPGFGTFTDAEVNLATWHPIEFAKYGECVLNAYNEATRYYSEGQLKHGNGDAFRHAYWNAILVPSFGESNPNHGLERAEVWTTAHESESKENNDKLMDLYNNEVGRYHAYSNYFTHSRADYSRDIRNMVSQGALARIDKAGNLVATNGYTGK